MKFIRSKLISLTLSIISLGLIIYGAFNQHIYLTIFSSIVAFVVTLYELYSSYKADKKLKSIDEEFGVERDDKGKITNSNGRWQQL